MVYQSLSPEWNKHIAYWLLAKSTVNKTGNAVLRPKIYFNCMWYFHILHELNNLSKNSKNEMLVVGQLYELYNTGCSLIWRETCQNKLLFTLLFECFIY